MFPSRLTLAFGFLSAPQQSHAVILSHMERIDASDSRVFAPISLSSPSTPLSLPASRSLYPAVAYDHAPAHPQSNRRLGDVVREEDINFVDSDASSSCPLLDDLSDESRPVSPPRRPDKLFHHQKLPLIVPKQKSPKKSPSPKSGKKVARGTGVQVDSERLARIRRMKFVRPSNPGGEEEVFWKDT